MGTPHAGQLAVRLHWEAWLLRHGFLMTLVAAAVIAAAVAAVWFSGRPLPGLSIP